MVDVAALVELGRALSALGYRFSTVTPGTHAFVNARPTNAVAKSLRDVFGWSRPFAVELLPEALFSLLRAAALCERVPGTALWRSAVRFSSLGDRLYAHSAFPTTSVDAVFFGPDSHRFVRAIVDAAPQSGRVVDVGCGSGVGGIALAAQGQAREVVLADINPVALRFAEANARLAGVHAEIIHSDLLSAVSGEFDLVIANPPYLRDDLHRAYRDGGGSFGERLAVRIVEQSILRLRQRPFEGKLLLYTGAAIVDGEDSFFSAIEEQLRQPFLSYDYQELDPDVFSDELARPAYAEVERIAAVFLTVTVHAPTQSARY